MAETVFEADKEPEGGSRGVRKGLRSRIAFWLLAFMVALAPLPDGSVASIWIDVWVFVAACIVLLSCQRNSGPGLSLLIAGLFLVVCAYAGVAVLQSLSPGPSPLPIWSEASAVLGTELSPYSASMREAPFVFLGRPLLGALALLSGIWVGLDRDHARGIARVVVVSATIYGVMGLLALVFSVSELRPEDQGGVLTAGFINRNTSATYLGSAFLVAFTIVFVKIARILREDRPVLDFINGDGRRESRTILALAAVLALFLPLTQSRAGVGFTILVGLAALSTMLPLLRRRDLWRVVFSALAALALVYALSGSAWRERQLRSDFSADPRWSAYGAMWDAIKDHPWLGLGLGSFSVSFTPYRTIGLLLPGSYNIGHSTPLEIMFEGGLPLAVVVIAFSLVCAVVLVRGVLRRPADPFILAGLLVGVLGCLHSSFDFSLQMPGYLIVCLAMVGIGLGRSFLPRHEIALKRRKVRRRLSGTEDRDIEPLVASEASTAGAAAPSGDG